jgi:integrase/predicted DNA-binding transcriptional regulator AlpA
MGRGGRGVGGSEGGASAVGREDLPDIVYVPDLAGLLRISAKAVRHRAARGQVPEPMRLGKELAWTRDAVLGWLRDSGRSARSVDMKITLRPYAKDTSRWQLDIRLMHPCHPERELRRRAVAPPGMDPKQARLWGERQVPSMLRALMGEPELPVVVEPAPARKEVAPKTAPPTKAAPAMTLADFYQQRFEPEHVRLQKHATRDYYAKMWRNHLGPLLGALPLKALDEDRISAFRAALHGRLAASTANVVLSKLGKMLRFARKLRTIDIVPNIERLPVPRKRPMAVLSDEAIARLVAAARRRGADGLAVCLLALDAGMRVSEICALEWGDIDLHEGAMIVQHNVYQGEAQTPKGRIGKLALTAALHEALTELRREHTLGPLVVYRRSGHTGREWAPHSPESIRYLLHQIQHDAGLKRSGPHLLRHTALTRLANLGASVYVIQAVARHAHLQTTQGYLHTQQVGLAREAATLLDRAALRSAADSVASPVFGNVLATPGNTPAAPP